MKYTKILLSGILLICLFQISIAQKPKEIVGYYANWQIYQRGGAFNPESVDYSRYTIIGYAFFKTDTNGHISGTDAWADSLSLRGRIDWGKPQPAYFPNTSLIDYAHLWGIKILPVIGGWTLSEEFPVVAAKPAARAQFAHECLGLIKEFQFDGIDIDWEYPNYAEHKGTPADKHNFTLLMQAIRDSIDAYGKIMNYQYIMMAAFGAAESHMQNIEFDQLVDVLDYFDLMTYDFNGPWDKMANHNSPLYSPEKGNTSSLDLSFKTLVNKYGVPAEKINLGTGFYGRSLRCVTELYQEGHCGTDTIAFAQYEGNPIYWNIIDKTSNYQKYWDEHSGASYMINKKDSSFLSYENEKAVRLKAEYVMQNNAAGLIIWEMSGDYIISPSTGAVKATPLVDEIIKVFKPARRKRIKKIYQ